MSIGIGDDVRLYETDARYRKRVDRRREAGHGPTPSKNRQDRAQDRYELNREADRLIRHLTKHPQDEQARAALLEAWERLGVAVIR